MLTVILDVNPGAWASLADVTTLRETVSSILIFINGHLSYQNSNKVAVIAAHPRGAEFLYPLPEKTNPPSKLSNGYAMYRLFREINEMILDQLDRVMESFTIDDVNAPSSCISGALSLALTYSNRIVESSEEHMDARVFLLSVTGELTSQYIPTMNCIFAAQKMKIPIDICKLAGDNVFLQQASDSTNGVYLRLTEPKGLVQYLMRAYSIDPSLRSHLVLISEKNVNFSAACFVTKKVVDIGYVCSVCLCILSIIPPTGDCPMCGTTYDKAALHKLTEKPVVLKKKAKKRKAEP